MSDTVDTSAGLSVGDCVLSFVASTTDLDAAFQRIPEQAAAAMGKAAASVSQLGDELDATGDNMDYAGENFDKLTRKIVEGSAESRKAIAEARGEAGLLGEMFDIHLPRHVRNFVAELPGVGAALSTAFTATAVLFLLDALVQGIEKIKEFANSASAIAEAWEAVDKVQAQMFAALDDNLLKAGEHTAELTNNPLEALRLKLQLLNNQSLAKLDGELEKLGAEADKAFEKMDRNWFSKMFLGLEGAEEAKNTFDEIGKAVNDALSVRTPEAFADAMKAVDKGIDESKTKLKELEEQQKQAAIAAAAVNEGANSGPDPRAIQAFNEAIKRLEAYKNAITEAQKTEHEEADNTSLEAHLKQIAEAASAAGKEATRQSGEAKHALDDQLENIQDFASAQHTAFENHEIDLATLKASEAKATQSAAIAHEHYLQAITRIYKQAAEVVRTQASQQISAQRALADSYAKSGDAARSQLALQAKAAIEEKSSAAAMELAQKAEASQEELVTLRKKDHREAQEALNKAMDEGRERIHKITEEYGHLIEANVAKEFEATQKAVEKLTGAEEELQKAQAKLAEDKLSAYYKDQEAAITRLAQMHLISEEQKDDRLKLLEQEQANAAIQILTDQLAKEKAVMDAAQGKVDYAKANPFTVTPAQLAELQANLDKVKTAYTNTGAELVETQEKFDTQSESEESAHNSKMLASGGKYYQQALLEAMAYGQQALAEQLKQNQAALLAAEAEMTQAKARGANTDAIKKEIEALKENEKALEKEASGGKITQAQKLKNVQAALAEAQAVLAEAKAHGADTTAMEQNVRQLQQLEKATQQVTTGDKALLAQMLLVNKAQLLAAQQMLQLAKDQGLDTTAIDLNIKALKQQQVVLNQESQELPKVNRDMVELKTSVQEAATTMMNSLSTAMAAVIKGQESFGAAMEKATLSMLGQMAQHWAQYYLALAIGNMWTDPGAAAEEFAAAAALEAISGVMSGLSSGGGGGSGAAQQQGPNVGTTTASSAGGGGSNQTTSVTKLAEGGVVSKPTMISPDVMAGDSPSGGEADEAILPLSDPEAMNRISKALAPGGQSENIPQQGIDSDAIDRMTKAIAALTGTRDPSKEFNFADQATGEAPGFQFAEATAGENHGFRSGTPTVGEALGFTSVSSPPAEKREFSQSVDASPAERSGFDFRTPSTSGETQGFSTTESSPATKSEMLPGGTPSLSDKSEFSFAATPPDVDNKPGISGPTPTSDTNQPAEFKPNSPTVGDALGFSSSPPSISAQREFTSSESVATGRQGFTTAAPGEIEAPGFKSSPSTVGEALGFHFGESSAGQPREFASSAPQTVDEALGVTSFSPSISQKSDVAPLPVAASSASEKAIFSPSGEPSPSKESKFSSAPGTASVPPIASSPSATVGQALGFTSSSGSESGKHSFSPGGESSQSAKSEFSSATPTPSPVAVTSAPELASSSKESDFTFAPSVPSAREAAGFTSGEPAPGEKSVFTSSQPSETEKADFLDAQPSVSEKQNFSANTPTVGEALGFKFDTPYPGDKPVFSSGQPSAPEKPGFSLAMPSAREQLDFEASSPSTVGEALGFGFSEPRASYEGLGFSSGQPSTSAKPGFSSGVQTPSEKPPLDIAPPSAGERPGFNFNAPSIPREMPDMEALAANFGGLLSQPTLRAASDAQAPAAAVAAASPAGSSPIDLEAHMERFAEKMNAQMQPEGRSSSGGGEGDTHVHVAVKGMISPDNLTKVIKKINRAVNNRQVTLKASDSQRLTRRSQ